MTKKVAKSWETHIAALIGVLFASNAYFVQRVIGQVDIVTSQVAQLSTQVVRVETKIENLSRIKCKK